MTYLSKCFANAKKKVFLGQFTYRYQVITITIFLQLLLANEPIIGPHEFCIYEKDEMELKRRKGKKCLLRTKPHLLNIFWGEVPIPTNNHSTHSKFYIQKSFHFRFQRGDKNQYSWLWLRHQYSHWCMVGWDPHVSAAGPEGYALSVAKINFCILIFPRQTRPHESNFQLPTTGTPELEKRWDHDLTFIWNAENVWTFVMNVTYKCRNDCILKIWDFLSSYINHLNSFQNDNKKNDLGLGIKIVALK